MRVVLNTLVLKINFDVTWGFTFFKYNYNKFKIISNILNIIVNNPVILKINFYEVSEKTAKI